MKRVNIRLKYYDYSQQGLYFITICCQKKACLFGDVANNQMHINPAGLMIKKWYYELENKFRSLKCNQLIIMPNHVHFILELVNHNSESDIQAIIQWLKTMTTNEYIQGVKEYKWNRFNKKLWQRSFYDHIIRDEESHNIIVEYINDNPRKLSEDKYYIMES